MTKSTKMLVVGAGLMALVAWISISVHFTKKREEMQKQHTQHLASLRDTWAKERKIKQAEYRAELEEAWGGGVMVAIRDPDLQIADMLRKAAIGACPECANAEVKTDNFNEFHVFLNVKSPLDKESAATAVRTLLRHCHKYVNSVSFVYSDEVVKTIDKRGIDAIKNWASVDLGMVARTMYTP